MKGKPASIILLFLLFVSSLLLVHNVQPVKASGTISINADGSINPPTAPISTSDNVTYTFTDNITDSIYVLRDNATIDGNGYTLQGSYSEREICGLVLLANFVKVKNTRIDSWYVGLSIGETNEPGYTFLTWGNTIANNSIAGCIVGISIIVEPYLGSPWDYPVWEYCPHLVVSNTIWGNYFGIIFTNDINISMHITVFHNDFINNSLQAANYPGTVNVWDDGYPSGGNYWSNYKGVDVKSGPNQDQPGSDGIGDMTYIIDANNSDNYPLMPHDVAVTSVVAERAWVCQGFIAHVNVTVLDKGRDENATVTLYYNITANGVIGAQNVTILAGENETLSFVWDTTGVPYNQNYTLTAVATIPIDNNPADNTLAGGPITVRIMGDINGDGKVDGKDIAIAAKAFGTVPGDPRWNLDCDINGDGKVDGKDIVLVARNFGK
jgi:hypothetical protein